MSEIKIRKFIKEILLEEWTKKYKKSIDCSKPKGFSQKAHCAARKKRQRGENTKSKSPFNEHVFDKLNLLNEITADDAYNKFYKNLFNKDNPNLDKRMYNKIIQLDPTFKKEQDKLGEYTKWLFRKDNIEELKKTKEEDLYKIKEDLELFNKAKIKNILPTDKKDINKFNIDSLLDFVFNFNKDYEDLMSKTEKQKEIKKDVKKYELSNWTIIIPETEEASCYYGKGTKWCTAADYNNRFHQYASEGDLYILINKSDPSEKYQFHFESSQFMDVKDRSIDLGEFFSDNSDIYDFFTKLKGDDLDFQICKNCLSSSNTDCFENFYSKNFTDAQKKELLREAFESNENSDSFYTVSTVLNYIDYPAIKDDFRQDFIWGIETSMRDKYDDENYNTIMFIDHLGGFNEENIDDILSAVDLKDFGEVKKLFQIAQSFNSVKFLGNYLESEEIDINFNLINTLEDLKSKFDYNDYEKTYESKLGKIKINKIPDFSKGLVNITFIKKNKNGTDSKPITGNVMYDNIANYLSTPMLNLKESIKKIIKNINNDILK